MPLVRACRIDELKEGDGIRLDIEPPIAVFKVGGQFYATDDTCTHADSSLGQDGWIEDEQIVCAFHMARFDVRTGEVRAFPADTALKTYPVEIQDDVVYVVV